MTGTPNFKIKNIAFPRIDLLFIDRPTSSVFQQMIRIEGLIIDDKNLRLLFGIKTISEEKIEEKTPKAQATVEAIANFEFDDPLPVISSISDIPLVGNMLALMLPFIREKINYCFSNNGLSVFLPPMNTIQLVKQNKNSGQFKIVDVRQTKPVET